MNSPTSQQTPQQPPTSPASNPNTETSPTTKRLQTETLTGTKKTNTVKYEVSTLDFGKTLKGPVYLMQEALEREFGYLPEKVRITVEEVKDGA